MKPESLVHEPSVHVVPMPLTGPKISLRNKSTLSKRESLTLPLHRECMLPVLPGIWWLTGSGRPQSDSNTCSSNWRMSLIPGHMKTVDNLATLYLNYSFTWILGQKFIGYITYEYIEKSTNLPVFLSRNLEFKWNFNQRKELLILHIVESIHSFIRAF